MRPWVRQLCRFVEHGNKPTRQPQDIAGIHAGQHNHKKKCQHTTWTTGDCTL